MMVCLLGVEWCGAAQPFMVRPPETLSTWPVTKAASSLAKKSDRARQVVGLADAAQRDGARERFHQLLGVAGAFLVVGEQRGVGRARGRPR